MSTQTQVVDMDQPSQAPRWNLPKRIAFRLCFVYLGLFVIYFCPIWLQYLLFLKRHSRLGLGGVWAGRQIVLRAGAHIFQMTVTPGPGVGFGGSFFWIEAICCLNIAV